MTTRKKAIDDDLGDSGLFEIVKVGKASLQVRLVLNKNLLWLSVIYFVI